MFITPICRKFRPVGEAVLGLVGALLGLLLWLAIGGCVGWLAARIVRVGARRGAAGHIIIGIIGAFVGALLFGGSINNEISAYTLASSLGGTVVLLALVNLARRGVVR